MENSITGNITSYELDAVIKRKSLGITILIHGLILLVLFFFVIHTQIPPFAEGTLAGGGGGNTLVDFGDIPIALESNVPDKPAASIAQAAAPAQDDAIRTTDI